MAKYKSGETSEAVINRKISITSSILKKAELLDSISSIDEVYESLNIKDNSISETNVHKWKDEKLGIISYSWNTAHAKHNSKPLSTLKKSIEYVNKRISTNERSNSDKKHKYTDNLTIQLRNENSDLKKALAEVYRAYMQLVEIYREDQLIDDAIRKLIIEQARILGKNRVWEVK